MCANQHTTESGFKRDKENGLSNAKTVTHRLWEQTENVRTRHAHMLLPSPPVHVVREMLHLLSFHLEVEGSCVGSGTTTIDQIIFHFRSLQDDILTIRRRRTSPIYVASCSMTCIIMSSGLSNPIEPSRQPRRPSAQFWYLSTTTYHSSANSNFTLDDSRVNVTKSSGTDSSLHRDMSCVAEDQRVCFRLSAVYIPSF